MDTLILNCTDTPDDRLEVEDHPDAFVEPSVELLSYQGGTLRGDIVLDRGNVEKLRDYLTAWLELTA